MNKRVIIIGGGVAGIQTAITLAELGLSPIIIEKDDRLGGKLNRWDRLFPSFTPAWEVLSDLIKKLSTTKTKIYTSVSVSSIDKDGKGVSLDDGSRVDGDAVIVASGFDIFNAALKEEYGYGIYNNVITSVDLEDMFKNRKVLTAQGKVPKRIAFLHCVGSRDEKVNQRHCSRVCCITGVKQAMEMKELIPDAEVYSFYMDMRMFGPGYEEIYRQAQQEYNIHFVRGRISEASGTMDGQVQIKAEDTLIGRPLKMTVDMLVLLVGMRAGSSNSLLAQNGGITLYPNGFMMPKNQFTDNVFSGTEGIFYAGTVSAPKNIGESMNEGIAAAHRVAAMLGRENK